MRQMAPEAALKKPGRGFRQAASALIAAALIASAHFAVAAERGCPAVGAIRWDAWHGASGAVGQHVEKTLAPSQYHHRLPFCSRILGPDQVEINCATQESMDKEIEYAVAAGLTYWAFATQQPDNPMSQSFKLYLASAHKARINFAMRSMPQQMGTPDNHDREISRFVQLMKDPSYQKVAGNRPLFFIGWLGQAEKHWGGRAEFRRGVEALRSAARRAGLANPYLVAMEFNPDRASEHAAYYGFDAITTYATRAGNFGASYAFLTRAVERYWDRSKATGAQVIPIVMSGWDNRPKAENPLRGVERKPSYYEQARPAEIANHLGNAIRWVAANPEATSANAILVYAWNEHDEGGWLAPTLSEGAARVEAVGQRVKRACATGAASRR
jgi:hypothetical protein